MLAIRRREPMLPFVRRQAILSAAGSWFDRARRLGMEANTTAAQRQRRHVRFLGGANRATIAAGDAINPVIQSPLETINDLLNVGEIEAAVQRAPSIRLAGSFCIF